MDLSQLRVLFRVAAGPRVGFGHLVRCRSLARAAGCAPLVSIRGSAATREAASRGGWQVVDQPGDAALRAVGPDILVVDDPSGAAAARWVARGRRAGVPVAAIHDLGLACVESDLGVDGSVEPNHETRGRFGDLRGLSYAILDPSVLFARSGRRAALDRVLIALGGGEHVHAMGDDLARAIVARQPWADVHIAAGFAVRQRPTGVTPGRWIEAPNGLASELQAASLAIVAGGVTLYEACAIGTPAIAIALTPAQHTTIRAMAERGAVIDAGAAGDPRTLRRAADEAARLLVERRAREGQSLIQRRLVDGRGAFRVADALRQLRATVLPGVTHAA